MNSRNFPRVGVIGAGQLARMMAVPANNLGIEMICLANNSEESAARISPYEIGSHSSLEDLFSFASNKDVITFEHELTPSHLLEELEKKGATLYPHPGSFLYSQNKIEMRKLMQTLNLPNPAWFRASNFLEFSQTIIEFDSDGANPFLQYPIVLKAPTGGYDGRGVWICKTQGEIENVFALVNAELLVEEAVRFDYEASIMVARSPHGQASTWAPTKTIQENGICTMTITPVPEMSDELAIKIQNAALEIAHAIQLVGVMAVEVFVTGENFVINELALRPHNSGHWSIEGSTTSQFEQHLRAILNLPLGDTSLTFPYTVMGNFLGPVDGQKGKDLYRPYLHLMAREPRLKLHSYDKESKPGRKIGHMTLSGDNWPELVSEMEHAIAYMQGEIDE